MLLGAWWAGPLSRHSTIGNTVLMLKPVKGGWPNWLKLSKKGNNNSLHSRWAGKYLGMHNNSHELQQSRQWQCNITDYNIIIVWSRICLHTNTFNKACVSSGNNNNRWLMSDYRKWQLCMCLCPNMIFSHNPFQMEITGTNLTSKQKNLSTFLTANATIFFFKEHKFLLQSLLPHACSPNHCWTLNHFIATTTNPVKKNFFFFTSAVAWTANWFWMLFYLLLQHDCR